MHGKKMRRSPIHQEITAYTTDPTVRTKSDKLAVGPSDHPRVKSLKVPFGKGATLGAIYKAIKKKITS